MKGTFASILLLPVLALANDHNNLEHGRPLRFDDAYSIAFGEREFQFGLGSSGPRGALMSSFAYGFAKNQELSFGFDATYGSSTSGELSYFQNVSRELEHAPALGFRVTATGAAGSLPSTELRLIATKAFHQYDKLHLNFDLATRQNPGFILGYSSPLGYPTKFDQTLVAELGYKQQERFAGIGMRRQIDPRSTFDLGIETGRTVRLSVGMSISF